MSDEWTPGAVSTVRKSIKTCKIELAYYLHGFLPSGLLTDNEVDILFHLMKDADVQEVLGREKERE